jgi:hypothetical protein
MQPVRLEPIVTIDDLEQVAEVLHTGLYALGALPAEALKASAKEKPEREISAGKFAPIVINSIIKSLSGFSKNGGEYHG